MELGLASDLTQSPEIPDYLPLRSVHLDRQRSAKYLPDEPRHLSSRHSAGAPRDLQASLHQRGCNSDADKWHEDGDCRERADSDHNHQGNDSSRDVTEGVNDVFREAGDLGNITTKAADGLAWGSGECPRPRPS